MEHCFFENDPHWLIKAMNSKIIVLKTNTD
jgi:hypothetical protein